MHLIHLIYTCDILSIPRYTLGFRHLVCLDLELFNPLYLASPPCMSPPRPSWIQCVFIPKEVDGKKRWVTKVLNGERT